MPADDAAKQRYPFGSLCHSAFNNMHSKIFSVWTKIFVNGGISVIKSLWIEVFIKICFCFNGWSCLISDLLLWVYCCLISLLYHLEPIYEYCGWLNYIYFFHYVFEISFWVTNTLSMKQQTNPILFKGYQHSHNQRPHTNASIYKVQVLAHDCWDYVFKPSPHGTLKILYATICTVAF